MRASSGVERTAETAETAETVDDEEDFSRQAYKGARTRHVIHPSKAAGSQILRKD
jgi:hypothetical protein